MVVLENALHNKKLCFYFILLPFHTIRTEWHKGCIYAFIYTYCGIITIMTRPFESFCYGDVL